MTIRINLSYFALLREQRGAAHETIDTNLTTPRALYQHIAQSYAFTLPPDRMGVAVNNHFVTLDQTLNDGDEVVFIPPVAGG